MLVLDSLSRQQKHNKNLVKYVDYVHSGVRVVNIVVTYNVFKTIRTYVIHLMQEKFPFAN